MRAKKMPCRQSRQILVQGCFGGRHVVPPAILRHFYEPGVRRRTIEVVVAGARNASSLLACAKETMGFKGPSRKYTENKSTFAAIYGVLYSRTLRIT